MQMMNLTKVFKKGRRMCLIPTYGVAAVGALVLLGVLLAAGLPLVVVLHLGGHSWGYG